VAQTRQWQKQQVIVMLTPTDKERFKARADAAELSMSEFGRYLIWQGLERMDAEEQATRVGSE
jgi:hypothetical protein